jgi:hypothetical protein
MTEVWIDVPKYEGLYKVSNTGKIKSLKSKNPRILKFSPDRDGKARVSLRRYDKTKTFYIHRIVYCAFHKLKLTEDICIVHKEHDMSNNALDNLKAMSLKKASRYVSQD